MIKSVFVDPTKLEGIEKSAANHLIVALDGLNKEIWSKLQNLGWDLSISISSIDPRDCPLNPVTKDKLLQKVKEILNYSPKEVWFDFLRFGGDCTDINDSDASKAHPSCQYCQNTDRINAILDLSKELQSAISGRSKMGLFTVAFKDKLTLQKALGLDYVALSQVFDIFSPMLYHRILKKDVSYISEYVRWLANTTAKLILPIIQIKDMPDDLSDEMTEEEITAAFQEAIKEPSMGVCFFWWNHALEKNKTAVIAKLFSSI